jgi:AraC-like DNA-binding protein
VLEVANIAAESQIQRCLLDDITLQHNLHIATDAHRALAELHTRDDLSTMVLDSLVTLILAQGARLAGRLHFHSSPPAWLLHARDYLHDHFRGSIKLADVARETGVAPAVLTRFFQRTFGMTPGEYARARRIDWCIQQLLTTCAPISTIAFQAGFADQSHFTRTFTQRVGLPPAAYRRAALG